MAGNVTEYYQVANFAYKTDLIAIKSQQAFPDLSALTLCVWLLSSASPLRSSQNTVFSYLPSDWDSAGVHLSLLPPNYVILSVNNYLVIGNSVVSL